MSSAALPALVILLDSLGPFSQSKLGELRTATDLKFQPPDEQ